MADPKTILQLTERSGALVATDEIEVQISGETTTKRKALSAVKTFVIGSATIGGNAAGDILTTNGTQTLTNKTLTSPTIGTAATLPAATTIGDVTAAELAKLHDLLPTTTELNYVDGVTSAIQTQFNNLGSITKRVFSYGVNYTTAALETTKTITGATLLADLAITGYLVCVQTVIATVYTNPSGGVYNSMATGTTIRINSGTSGGVESVTNLVFSSLSAETSYTFVIHYSLIAEPVA